MVELLPDNIDIDLRSKDDVIHLQLTRMKQIDPDRVYMTFDDPNFSDSEKLDGEVGYYQDKSNYAAISIEAKVDGIHITRTLTGTLVNNGNLHEVYPAKEDMEHIRRVFEENGLYHDPTLHNLHILKEVDEKFYRNVDKVAKDRPDMEPVSSNEDDEEEEMRLLSKLDELVRSLKNGPENLDIRTSVQKRYDVQLMFVINYDIWKEFQDKYGTTALQRLKHYYHQILNGMYLAYTSIDDPDLEIILWLSRMHVITKSANSLLDNSNKIDSLSKGKERATYNADKVWPKMTTLAKQLKVDTAGGKDVDHMMFWTRQHLNSDGDLLGIAYMCAVCSEYSQSQCKDNGYLSWHTAGHELGHSLGARHDEGKRCGGNESAKYIMHFEDYEINIEYVEEAYKFSNCSASDMKKCLTGTGNKNYRKQGARICLLNRQCKHGKPLVGVDKLLGSIITLDRQCQLFYGDKNAKFCGKVEESICRQLPCQSVRTNDKCVGFIARAAPGSKCDTKDKSKVCYLGQCSSAIPESPIDNDSCDTTPVGGSTVTYPTPTIQLGSTGMTRISGTSAPSYYSTTYSPMKLLRKLKRKLQRNVQLIKHKRIQK